MGAESRAQETKRMGKISALDRSNQGRTFLRPRLYGTLEQRRVTRPELVTSVIRIRHQSLPDHSVAVTHPRLDHVPKLIDIFLDVEHRQRHSTGKPYRRLRNIKPRTYNKQRRDKSDRQFRVFGEGIKSRQHPQILLPNPKTVARGSGSGLSPKNLSGLNSVGLV